MLIKTHEWASVGSKHKPQLRKKESLVYRQQQARPASQRAVYVANRKRERERERVPVKVSWFTSVGSRVNKVKLLNNIDNKYLDT